MAHADIFEKLSREIPSSKRQVAATSNTETRMEPSIDKKAIETLKILGKQVIEMKEFVDEQTKLINLLQEEILRLKKIQTETKGDVQMVVIDQRDVAKQLRMLKAVVTGEMHVNNRIQQEQSPHQQYQQAPQSYTQNPHYDSSAEAVAKRFYNNYDQSNLFKNNPEPQSRPVQQQVHPQHNHAAQANVPAQHKSGIDHSKHAESVAKEFIFGRIPKLLNLE